VFVHLRSQTIQFNVPLRPWFYILVLILSKDHLFGQSCFRNPAVLNFTKIVFGSLDSWHSSVCSSVRKFAFTHVISTRVLYLIFLAFLGFLFSFISFLRWGVSWFFIVVRALDLITIVIPPALPAAMSIGTSFAINRLKKGNVFCISPPRVNICGKLNVMVFDKTGTLTEDGLDVFGVQPVSVDYLGYALPG
jgi:P-type E1-E2 ATPase